MLLIEVEYGNQGNLYIKDNEENIYIKEIQYSKNAFSEISNAKKIFYKNKGDFFIPINNKPVSFLAANGTGKTLINKNIYNFFLNYDKRVSKQAQQTEFLENDNFSIINKYVILNTTFKTDNNIKNIHLFSLNSIYSHQYDYLLLPHLEYVIKRFNLVRIFNDYINESFMHDFIDTFNDAISNSLENRDLTFEEDVAKASKYNLIFDEIKERSIISLLVYLVEKLSHENNLSIEITVNRIINNPNLLSWKALEKFSNNFNHIKQEITELRSLVISLISFSTTHDGEKLILSDVIIKSVNYFKNTNPFYELFKNDFVEFRNFIKDRINNNFLNIDGDKNIKLIEHYYDLFDTTIYFPISITTNDKTISLDTFYDNYDRYDKYSVRSVFSLIEKNGSEFEKINYKNMCALFFLLYLKNSITLYNSNDRILILSDDVFSQTDNHNVLINLLEFHNELEKQNLSTITTWMNLTHSFSAFQIFNKSLNVDYDNMFIIKKTQNNIQVEPLRIKNKFFVEYLNKKINQNNINSEEKVISIFTKLVYDRFLCENLPNSKTQENILTNFLHYFSKDLENIVNENYDLLPEYLNFLVDITKQHFNAKEVTYDLLFSFMDKVFDKNPLDYKNSTDIEICFFYSIYLRFLIEKNIFKFLKPSNNEVNEKLNYTGSLIELLKNRKFDIYTQIIGIYNLSKNYIHYDYISYDSIIFVNPYEYKKNILQVKKILDSLNNNTTKN